MRTLKPAEEFMHLNFPLVSLPSFHIVCLAIIFAFREGDVFKSPAALKEQAKSARNDTSNDTSYKEEKKKINKKTHDTTKSPEKSHDGVTAATKPKTPPSIGELTKFVLALLMSPRGLQCTWSPPPHIVPLGKATSKSAFVGETIMTGIIMHLLFLTTCAFAVPSCQNPRGAYGFLTEEVGLPPSQLLETVSPYILTLVFGGTAYSGFSLLAALFNLVEVTVYWLARIILPSDFKPEEFDPVWYPPLFSAPWSRHNLTDFWAKDADYIIPLLGWHATFRYDFIYCGAMPFLKIFGGYGPVTTKIAGLAGAMLCSAAMHEIALVSITKIDWTFVTTKMFLGQGLGIVMETIYRKLTGKKVRMDWIHLNHLKEAELRQLYTSSNPGWGSYWVFMDSSAFGVMG
ncbi:uncharacterized protein MELLADRAFT_92231 [Melampsora larici-populina 98AG31]|uniref:Wax synthase domain-containing protein n=1 Tax=Melampsora larici-populina (strain 98AG31 / pathotype 3-4-7) TaxID=747676 RepID=F4R8W7_MELLP|nr:uncharacterized protein MELLADRAFT_92231 [Melampsora larici-populina 98AG31]EGG11258.1 hypothetical protein MELLADRAFT_92231 [Melampsora larici-populina 98AG31]